MNVGAATTIALSTIWFVVVLAAWHHNPFLFLIMLSAIFTTGIITWEFDNESTNRDQRRSYRLLDSC